MKIKEMLYSTLFVIIFLIINIPFIKALLLPKLISFLLLGSVALGILYYYKTETLFLFKILGFCLFLNLFFVIGWLETPWPTPPIQHKELCLQYLSEGTLYGGQPYCGQGPVFYIVGKLIQLFPGDDDINFQISAVFFLFILFVILYLLKKKITTDTSFFFLEICFIFYFIRIAEDDMTSLVAVTFLLIGLYFLYASSTKYRKIYGAIFLGFSLFSKAQFLLAVFPCIFFYNLNMNENNIFSSINVRNIRTWTSFFKSLAIFSLPILFLFLTLLILFPHFFSYYYLAQFAQSHDLTLTEAVSSLVTSQYVYNGLFFLFYLCLFSSILRILHKKSFDLFSFMCSFVFFFMITKMIQTYGINNISESYRYLFVIMPFFIINIYLLKNEFPKFNKKLQIFAVTVLLIFIFIFYQIIGGITFGDFMDGSIFHEQRLIKKLQREISYPLFEIEKPLSGKTLIFENYTSLFGNNGQNPFLYLNESDLENLKFSDPYKNRPDTPYAESLVKIGIVESFDQYSPVIQINYTENLKRLYNSSYSIIIEGMQYPISTKIISRDIGFFQKTYPCSVVIGILSGGYSHDTNLLHTLTVDFMNQEDCNNMATKIYNYYTENYDYLCTRGLYNSILIKEIFRENNLPAITKNCNTWHRTTDFIVAAHFKAAYLGFFILLFLGYVILRRK